MPFNYQSIDLPVKEVIPEVKAKLEEDNTLIIKAPTGAGKSTLLPIALLEEAWLEGKKIILLEPRRIAAKTIATRMAELLGEQVGETVGYRIRFDNKISAKTRLEVVTEGILTRMIHDDNELKAIGMVIFDEFHERSIHADVAMALSRETQQILRPDLRIFVMSATIDMPLLAEMLNASVVESEGRMFPVEVKYVGDADERMIAEQAVHVIEKAVSENDGDTLVFLPGQGEIKKCEDALRRTLKDFEIHPLFGMLPPSRQMAALFPSKSGKRKIVLATNIAETSLTIEGIKIVVDSGFERKAKFNPKSGMSKLQTVQISKESADQRKGRAGRLTAGNCYRMWSKATHAKMAVSGTPEIEEVDLGTLVLDLAQWGIINANELSWLSPPPPGNLAQATNLLHELDALQDGQITDHGKRLHQLPTHPRIAHMLIMAQDSDQLELATDIAPLLEERDPLGPEKGIDINYRIQALRRYRREKAGPKRLGQIEKMAKQYRQIFNIEADNAHYDESETAILLAHAYPERIACARPGNNAQFQLANGKIAMAGHRDDLADETWLAIAHVSERENIGKIFMAAALNPQDLSPLVKQKKTIRWDTKKGGLIASNDLRIGNIVLKSIPIQNPDESLLIQAITEAIAKEGKHLLDWNEESTQLLNRVQSLKQWNKNLKWPDYNITSLLLTNKQWLEPYLNNVKKPEDLKKIDLHQILYYNLNPEQQKALDQLAPAKIEVPSGSKISIEYQEKGAQPVLAVRLQECFGLLETPTVNNGKVNLLMHLLSPGFKMVQITDDLASFWANAYFEVRKELRVKYKRHAWPEDPLSETPIRGAKKRR